MTTKQMSMTNDTVTIIIKETNDKFVVDRKMLIDASKKFKKMLTQNKSNEIEISGYDRAGVKYFLAFLCSPGIFKAIPQHTSAINSIFYDIYGGSLPCNMRYDLIKSVFPLAHHFKCKESIERCITYVKVCKISHISIFIESISKMLFFSKKYSKHKQDFEIGIESIIKQFDELLKFAYIAAIKKEKYINDLYFDDYEKAPIGILKRIAKKYEIVDDENKKRKNNDISNDSNKKQKTDISGQKTIVEEQKSETDKKLKKHYINIIRNYVVNKFERECLPGSRVRYLRYTMPLYYEQETKTTRKKYNEKVTKISNMLRAHVNKKR